MGASESKPEIKIILAGKTGVGKSSTGNTILKKQFFQSESSPNSKTKDSTTGNGMVYNKRITVIDTPGILSTIDDEEKVKEQLIRALLDCAPGPFVVVFVLKVERYTSQEREIETKIWEYFKDIDSKQALVLFTHGAQLEGQTIEEFVKKSPRLQEYVEKCEGRCHVIDSKHWKKSLWGYESNRFQVKNLLDTIDKMRKECYTNELLLILDEEITEETELTDPNLSQQERREKAKMKVFKKLCIRFAGVATGTLVGALMGIATPVAALVGIMKGLKNISTNAEEAEKETLLDLDKATAGEIKKTAAAVLGATAAAAVGTSASVGAAAGATAASVGAAAGATAAVEAGVAVGAASASVGAAASISAGAASASIGATAAGATAAVEAGVAAGAAAGATAAAGGAVAAEAGVAAGASIGVAAGSGIAVGAVFGAAALAGAIGGGITGYKAVDNADSVVDAIKIAAKANYENVKGVIKKGEELPTKVHDELGRRL